MKEKPNLMNWFQWIIQHRYANKTNDGAQVGGLYALRENAMLNAAAMYPFGITLEEFFACVGSAVGSGVIDVKHCHF